MSIIKGLKSSMKAQVESLIFLPQKEPLEYDSTGGKGRIHRAFIPCILMLLIFLMYLILYFLQEKLITQDGTLWISYGLQMFQGDLHTFQFDGGAPAYSPIVYSPGYPFLVGLLNLVIRNPVFSAYLVSMTAGSLLCLIVFFITRELFNKKIGYIALLLCGVYTGMKYYAVSTWIRAAGMLFLLLGLYLFLLSIRRKKSLYAFCTGLALGAALLVRFEFAFYAIVAGAAFLFYVWRRRVKFKALVLYSGALILVYSLYAVPLYLYSGYRVFSPYISEKFLGEKMPDKPQFNHYRNKDIADRVILFNHNTAHSFNLSKQNRVKVSKADWEKYGNQTGGSSGQGALGKNYEEIPSRYKEDGCVEIVGAIREML